MTIDNIYVTKKYNYDLQWNCKRRIWHGLQSTRP
jgi:hypothetical protein